MDRSRLFAKAENYIFAINCIPRPVVAIMMKS